MKVEFEGTTYELPDGTSDQEIPGLIKAAAPPGWTGAIKAMPGIAKGYTQEMLGGMLQWAFEPSGPSTAEQIFGKQPGVDKELLKGPIQRGREAVAEAGAGIAESGRRNLAADTPAGLTYWQNIVAQGGAQTITQLPPLALSIATGNPAPSLAAAAAMAGGPTYSESRAQGLSPLRSNIHATIDAASEAGFELLPTNFILDNVGGPVLKLITGTLFRELPTEIATQIVQGANAKISTNPDQTWQEYGQSLLDVAAQTLVMAPMLAVGGKVLSPLERRAITGDNRPQEQPESTPDLKAPVETPDLPTIPLTTEGQQQAQQIIQSIDVTQVTPEQVQQDQAELKKIEDEYKSPPADKAQLAWRTLADAPQESLDVSELGASRKQAGNAPNYVNPNVGDRLDRTFSFGPEEAIGKTPRQIMPQQSTYVLGEATADRPAEYLHALRETVEGWRNKFLPNSTIVLSNEGMFSDSALGWHYNTQPGFHMIVPAVIRSPKMGMGAFNVNTQASAFYNATHEFGHALTRDRFFEGVSPIVAQSAWEQSRTGLVDQEIVNVLPPNVRAVVEEFNALKSRIMDGSMSAQQFVEEWVGPAKAGRETLLKDLGVAPTASAQSIGTAMAQRASELSNIVNEVTKGQIKKDLIADFFSLDEYLAEQTARLAYQKRWHVRTKLGQYFFQALEGLRNHLSSFFKYLKQTGGIRAGTAFQSWMEDLARGNRPLTKQAKVARGKAAGPAKVQVAAKKAVEGSKLPKVKRTQSNIESSTKVSHKELARRLVANLVRQKILSSEDPDFKQLLKHAKAEEWDEFMDLFSKYGIKDVKFELDDTIKDKDKLLYEKTFAGLGNLSEEQARDGAILADAAKEWNDKGFASKYFKAWFGDWQDPKAKNVSAVVTGATREPLGLFHWTRHGLQMGNSRLAFTHFARGDIGFHFGTIEAAHSRAGATGTTLEQQLADPFWKPDPLLTYPDQIRTEGSYIIPVVLNLKNPLDIGVETPSMWSYPNQNMVAKLEAMGVISSAEGQQLNRELTTKYNLLTPEEKKYDILHQYVLAEPIRTMLVSKGYDGMVYDNLIEGGRSWVAFFPEQVKSLLGHHTFSKSKHMHLETNWDASSPEGEGSGKMLNSFRNFMDDPSPFRRAFRRVADMAHQVLQIQQLAQLHPELSNLVSFNKFNTDYNLRKAKLQAPADAITSRWQWIGKENQSKAAKFFLEEMEGKENWFDLVQSQREQLGQTEPWWQFQMSARAQDEMLKRGIDISTEDGQEMAQLMLDVKNDLLNRLNEKEKVLQNLMIQRYSGNPQALNRALRPLMYQIHELRKFPFFPQGRFGNHMLIVEKKNDRGGWDVVYREAFESKTKRDQAWMSASKKTNPDERVRSAELSDTTYVLMALPSDFLEVAASELDLSPEQVQQLQDIMQPVRTEKALKVYDQARLGIKGYTTDALRAYANFAWHDSNLLAKMEYRAKFNQAISGMRRDLRVAQTAEVPNPGETNKLFQVMRSMEKARDYIMSPPNELQGLRAFISVAYLGLNVKTALLNLYGLVTTWSAVTSELGMMKGSALMTKSMFDTMRSIKLTNFNERRNGDYLAPDQREALDRALEEGVLSQSYAYHLAGMANAGNLNRLIKSYRLGATLTKGAIDLSMWPFRLTELSTRRASFLATYELAKQKKANGQLLNEYDEAVRLTNLLQNDYSLGNRVPFMRGGFAKMGPLAPLATVFMSFAQHMAFHSYGGYEIGERRAARVEGQTPRTMMGGYTMKIWIVTLLLAGYEGLPGAENIIDLLEGMWRKFGGAKPLRQEIREFVQALDIPGIDPQTAAHGLGHNMAGYDISRSVGFGRFLPGTDVFAHPREGTEEMVGQLTLDMLGAAGSFLKFGLDTTFNNKPLAENLKRLPGGLGNLYVAYDWHENGVRGPNGGLVTHDLQTGKLRDLTAAEIWGKALGFNPTIVSENREIAWQQYDRKMFWQNRRKGLLDDYWRAYQQRDREAMADVRTAVHDFNADIPRDFADVRIRPIDLSNSLKTHRRLQRAEEQGVAPEKRYRSLYRDIKGSYGQ